MPIDRVAALCGALLWLGSCCALSTADDGERPIASDPFALPNTLKANDAGNEGVAQRRPAETTTRTRTSRPIGLGSSTVNRGPGQTSNPHSRQASRATQERDYSLIPIRRLPVGSTQYEPTSRSNRLATPEVDPSTGQTVIRAGGYRQHQQLSTQERGNQERVSIADRIRLVADEQFAAQRSTTQTFIGNQTNTIPIDTNPVDTGADPFDSGAGVLVPVRLPDQADEVEVSGENGLVSLVANDADLKSVLRMIADHHGLNLVLAPEIQGPVTVSIRGARLEEVLDAILGVAGFSWNRSGNLLYVTSASAIGIDPRVQGRSVRVYHLDYVSAADVQQVATGLLSPVGAAFISESDSADELKTRETLVVEDTVAAHRRIEQYISQVDVPPLQVLIEAHVLQIALGEEEQHGIDLQALLRLRGTAVTFSGLNFTDVSGTDSDLAVTIDGSDLDGVIQLIRRCTNSRTLASPKVSVVNRQEAKIQIGQRLPYSVATTTQTTTVESVEFLEVGIVLTVRPVITEDGNVLMYVLPKVSGGKITPNGFPEEETTEVQTTIMIPDGGGVVIGGLIREENIQSRAVVPYFHKVPVLGHLFKGRSDEMRRNELVVALVAHVIHPGHGPRMKEVIGLEEALPADAMSELRQR
ncbi:MAG: secretin N-terminal domain-containing protein [Planctomycetota bacterium]